MSIVINHHVSIYSNDQFKSLCCEWKYLWRLTAILCCYISQIWFNLRPTSPAAKSWSERKVVAVIKTKAERGMHDGGGGGEGVWTVCRMEQKWVRFWNWMIHIQSHTLKLSWSTALLIFVWYFKNFNRLFVSTNHLSQPFSRHCKSEDSSVTPVALPPEWPIGHLVYKLVNLEGCLMHQSIPSTNIPPGGFALYCCPGAGIYTLWPSPGAGFLHIHKITFSTVKKCTFTQLAFGSYLHALHRQFRLSILAWLNTKILKQTSFIILSISSKIVVYHKG